MSENPQAEPRPRRSRLLVGAIAVTAVVLAAGAGFGVRWLLDGRGADPAAAQQLTLAAADSEGENPFTASVVAADLTTDALFTDTVLARTVEITEQATAAAVTGSPQVPGSAPGLYGGSGTLGVCDATALVGFLAADDGKAAAWAGALGIAPDTIADYVAGLTAVVLTADTLVTNHGFSADGAATPHPSVLQAGTAVLVDPRGLPTVRCACGNPLLPAAFSASVAAAETVGTGWDGLDLGRVVTVAPAASDVVAFTVTDLTSGELVELAVGTGGADAIYLATSSNHAQASMDPEPLAGTIRTSPDGAEWTTVLETTPMLDVATGAGLAVAVGLGEGYSGAIHTSTDGVSWSAAIPVIDPLTAVAHGDGTWVAVGDRSFAEEGGAGDGSSGAIYRSDDAVTWERVATTDPYENAELAGRGELMHQSMTSVAYGNGSWIASATECSYRTCMRVLFTSTDTRSWTRLALDNRIVLVDLAHNGQEWAFVGGERTPDPANNAEIDYPIGAAGTSQDGLTWAIGATQPDRVVLTGLNPGADSWLAVDAYVPRTATDPPPAGGIYRSSDILTWERIGTAGPWTTSVALLAPTATVTTPPQEPVGADVGTVRVRTEGVELLTVDGVSLQLFPYEGSASTAIAAVTDALGAPSSEFLPGDGICSEDRTSITWGGLRLVHPGTEASASGWFVVLDGDGAPAGSVTADGPGGVALGQDVAAVRAANPEAPGESFSYEGVTYDYLYLDVVPHQGDGVTYEMAVSIGAEDGVVSHLHAPAYVEGDC